MKKILHSISSYKFTLLTAIILNTFVSFSAVVSGNMSPMSFSPSSVNQAIYDLDNNGQFDFKVKIIYLGSSNYTMVFNGLNGAKFETDGSLELIGYNEGTPLGGNSYQDSGYVKSLFFPEGTIKYVGLTFKINGVSHCAYVGVRASSYYQGFFDFWTFGYETNSSICINANATSSSASTINEDFNSQIKLYPNPSAGNYTLELGQNMYEPTMTLTDIYGKIILSNMNLKEPLINLSINEPVGTYFLVLENEEKKEVIRIIKE